MANQIEHAYQQLVKDMDSGKFPPMSLLPPGRILCKEYNVSHPTLWKAVTRLVQEGRLRSRQGSGTRVEPLQESGEAAVRTVGLMLSCEDHLLKHAQRLALDSHCLLNVFFHDQTCWEVEDERRFMQCILAQEIRVLIAYCSPRPPTNAKLLQELEQRGTRIIHQQHFRLTPPDEEYILPDYPLAGKMAVNELLRAGYGPLAMVAHWDEPSPSMLMIERGVLAALEAHSIPLQRHERYRPEVRDEAWLRAYLAALPDGMGLIVDSPGSANRLVRTWQQLGRDADALGIVAIGDTNNHAETLTPRLNFDRAQLLSQVFAAIFETERGTLKTWQTPTWERSFDPNTPILA